MENNLGLVQTQKLAMTQQMRQAIKILQLSTYELNEYLEDQIMSNPLLDMPEIVEKQSVEAAKLKDDVNGMDKDTPVKPQSIDWKEYFNANDYSNHEHFYYDPDDTEYNAIERIPYEDSTLTDYLMLQLNTCDISENEYRIAELVIESIDDSGYLTSTAREIMNETGAGEIGTVLDVIEKIQQFDPPGVGAANLRECLLIQIDQLSNNEQIGLDLELPRKIVEDHLQDLAKNKLANITRALDISTQEAQEACDFIKTLEPRPGRNFIHDEQTKYIIPDIIIEKTNGEFVINISSKTVPKLRINKYYKKYLSENSDKDSERDAEIVKYINEKLNSAMWLIKSVEQRRSTIYKLVESILSNQYEFFNKGKAHLKYLTLKQVADELGVHISTVSRAASGKYLQCGFGVFELKYFFDSGVSVKSECGPSSKSVKEMIQNMIKSEDAKDPSSDQRIVEMLAKQGIELSRRTVAKYRSMMGIQPSSERKRY